MSDRAPTNWLSTEPAAELPEPGAALPRPVALEAPQPKALPPGIAPAPTGMAQRGQSLPLQAHAQPPLWPRGRVTHRAIAPRAVGEVSHDFGGHMLGFSTMAVAIGAIVGTRYGGMYGGAAGSLIGGSLVNIYRSVRFAMEGTDEGDREAVVSGTYALAAAGFGGLVIYKLDRRRTATPNSSSACRNAPRRCDFRPTGL